MPDGFDNISGACFALGANHRSAFGYSTESLPQIAAAADERHLKIVFPNVVSFVSRSYNLRLIDVVDTQGFQNLSFDEMTDAHLSLIHI